ncbi:MAG: hypothetical protein CL600_03465 [Alteromonas sp.]|jgi:uncharacterized protein YfiM (DUF2279 family)|uniref:hypothetical protein n=1 Tax=unclassified Alteromonas TaxID=2614992 RepID=UPI000903F103|nr:MULTISPECIES: hypothetical protein [unclassified Alteromonas]APE04873.1 hypothetical protein BM528_03055 [Alteromonas sp. RW2A1]AUC87275.1 hypothetical protein CW735_02920 [Alteromonas sp. MB-3u-76]MAI63931.1 hypothetical protein [Alteromonas sp.]
MILRIIKWFSIALVVIAFLSLVSAITLTAMAIQSTPLVTSSASSQLDGADSVQVLLSQLKRAFSRREEGHQVVLSETQVESLVGVLQRGLPDFKGQVNITSTGGTANLTYAIKDTGYFFNVSALVLPGDNLRIEHVQVGSLSIPGRFLLNVIEYAVNNYTNSEIATLALSRVEKVSMRRGELTLDIGRLDTFLNELNTVASNLSVDEETELQTLTAYYLRYISGREIALSNTPVSLIEYLREGMARAREQSNSPQQAVLHNKAVILALAAYVGHHRVGNLVGDIQPDKDKALRPRAGAVLHNRNDLARHYIISAALELLSEQSMSFAIGEFKELMDRGIGGSGYSFVDLVADMSGTELAKTATTLHRAEDVQNTLARIRSEVDIIPAIDDIPEGLSKQAFTEQYGRVDSHAYLNEVARLKQRIVEIPLYKR